MKIVQSSSRLKQLANVAAVVALLAGFAGTAQADVVYDSLSGIGPILADVGGITTYNYQYQCFAACTDPINGSSTEAVSSIGDLISLTPNSGRAITSIDVGIVQGKGSSSIDLALKLSIFDATTKALQVSQITSTATLGAVAANYPYNGAGKIVQFSVGPFNLPDTFYYTLSLVSPPVAPTNFGIWLWDYYNNGTPGSIPVGTDIGNTGSVANFDLVTQVYGTLGAGTVPTTALGNNTAGLSNGYTPAITFNVATPLAVPEPSTYLLLLVGFVALVVVSRRVKKH